MNIFFTGAAPSGITGSWTLAGAQVPEPATLALFGIGLAGLGFRRRKRTVN